MKETLVLFISRLTALTVVLSLAPTCRAGSFGQPIWTRHIVSNDFDIAFDVAASTGGAVAVTGRTQGLLAGMGNDPPDAFVSLFENSGTPKWVDQFDRPDEAGFTDEGQGLIFDSFGNLYVTGALGGVNEADAFLRKYDGNGGLVWAHAFDVRSSTVALDIELDASGRVLICGGTRADFGTSAAFVSAFNSNGAQLWSRTFGTSAGEGARRLAVDGAGNIYVAGQTFGAFGGQSQGDLDDFVMKLDSNGNQLWVRQFGSTATDYVFGVDVDAAGDVYVAGVTGGALASNSMGDWDAYTLKYTASGTQAWARQLGSAQADWIEGLSVSPTGMVIAAGHTRGSLFAPNAGQEDVLLLGYDSQGQLVKQSQFGSVGRDNPRAVTTSPDGQIVYVAGNTTGELFGDNIERTSHAFVVALLVPEPRGKIHALIAVLWFLAHSPRRRLPVT